MRPQRLTLTFWRACGWVVVNAAHRQDYIELAKQKACESARRACADYGALRWQLLIHTYLPVLLLR